jgi:predicted ATPase
MSPRRDAPGRFKAPFLRRLAWLGGEGPSGRFPLNLPIFASGSFALEFRRPVAIFVGENATGKSTLLEAIAANCGFNPTGGSRNHFYGGEAPMAELARAMRLSWLPRMTKGFFMRAESFFDFASYIDALASEDPDILEGYGGKSLHERSHGESFMALFLSRFGRRGIYILDEPEAALSPTRQLAFLRLLRELEATGDSQWLIATHSPILMAYPGAQLFYLDGRGARECDYRETPHYRLIRDFLNAPDRYLRELMRDEVTGGEAPPRAKPGR